MPSSRALGEVRGSLFRKLSVGAADHVVACTLIPIITFVHGFPLLTRSLKIDRLQLTTAGERTIRDPGHAGGDSNRRQPGTKPERIVSDARDAVRDDGSLTSQNKRFGLLFYQTVVFAAIGRIPGVDFNGRQPATIVERIFPDPGHAGGDANRRQPGTKPERRTPDARDAVRDDDGGQPATVLERTSSDARNAVGDGDRRQPGATGKRIRRNVLDVVADRDGCQIGTTGEYRIVIFSRRRAVGGVPYDRRQPGAIVERRVFDARDAIGNCDRGQPLAIGERKVPDARDAVADGDRGQTGAAAERRAPDTLDIVRNRHRGQADTVEECPKTDLTNVTRYRYVAAGTGIKDQPAVPNGECFAVFLFVFYTRRTLRFFR